MSYCVNCGVQLHPTCGSCPLCHTPVVNPNQAVDLAGVRPFPQQKGTVEPVSKRALAFICTAMLVSVAVCCGLLNLFFFKDRLWSMYIIGAVAMLWIWLVLPLLVRTLPLGLRLFLDACAVGLYVRLIALDLGGEDWYMGVALPILVLLGLLLLSLGYLLRAGQRSILSSIALIIGFIGLFLMGVEYSIDQWLIQTWQPGWSLVTMTVCLAMVIPLVIVRRVPSLREEARRRFHI